MPTGVVFSTRPKDDAERERFKQIARRLRYGFTFQMAGALSEPPRVMDPSSLIPSDIYFQPVHQEITLRFYAERDSIRSNMLALMWELEIDRTLRQYRVMIDQLHLFRVREDAWMPVAHELKRAWHEIERETGFFPMPKVQELVTEAIASLLDELMPLRYSREELEAEIMRDLTTMTVGTP